MQVSTTLFYDAAAKRMASLNARADTLQTQIATGKRVQSPSQDAALAQQVAEFDRSDANAAVYKTNLDLSGSLLDQTDSVLTSMVSQLQRAKELTVSAANGTQTAETRKAIGVEMAAIVESLAGLANSQGLNGQPLFGTANGTPAVTRDDGGIYRFAATSVSPVPIGDGQTIQATESAKRVFDLGDGTDTLTMLAMLAGTLANGDAPDGDTLDAVTKANDQVAFVQSSVGARGARVELQQSQLATAADNRAALRSSVEDVDITTTVTELQKVLTVLSATQASFSKLSSLSLFDYLK